jgi:ribosomal protein S18 acetylase RimI-like enzyme
MIEIDRATFADCPYTAEQVVALESDAEQYAWVACDGDRVVGYVSAFATHSLAAGRWEVDELAVHPEAQGRGIGTALVARALEVGAGQAGLHEARALVAVDNLASQRVFLKNGFRAVNTVDLLSYRIAGRVPRPPRPGAPAVRLAQARDCSVLAELLGGPAGDAMQMAGLLPRPDVRYLLAGERLGCAELIHVRTLQYEGLWIESLAVSEHTGAGHQAALALFGAAIERAKRQENLDLVGYLAQPRDRALYSAAVAEGMALLATYRSFVYDWRGNA